MSAVCDSALCDADKLKKLIYMSEDIILYCLFTATSFVNLLHCFDFLVCFLSSHCGPPYRDSDCWDKIGMKVHDPPLLFDLLVDPSEQFVLTNKTSEYAAAIEELKQVSQERAEDRERGREG